MVLVYLQKITSKFDINRKRKLFITSVSRSDDCILLDGASSEPRCPTILSMKILTNQYYQHEFNNKIIVCSSDTYVRHKL